MILLITAFVTIVALSCWFSLLLSKDLQFVGKNTWEKLEASIPYH
jgi:hypothetical protein